ncbi:MAG TPA: MMPL family transporter, partial [Humisphaera sp.]|nr:MMPL family transporter [Humisphaera sp.]
PISSKILTFPIRRPRLAIVVASCFALIAAMSAARIRTDASLQAMFSHDNPAGQSLARVMEDFGAVDELLVLATVPGGAEASPADIDRLLQFGQRFTVAVSADPQTAFKTDGAFFKPDSDSRDYVEKVLVPSAIYYLDPASFAAAQERLTKPSMKEQLAQDESMMAAPGAAGAISKALMRDPLRLRDFLGGFLQKLQVAKPFAGREGTDAFVSPDGHSLLVRVRGKQSPSDLEYCKALVKSVAAVADRVNADHLELRFAGSYAIAAESATAVRGDLISSVVGSVICLQLLFLLAYRSPWKLFAMAFGPIALGLVLGFGVFSLLTMGLTPMTAVLGGILTGMAIDYSIQYLSMYESRRDAGAAPRSAAEDAAIGITPAALAAWATSVVGFIAIGASSATALRDFSLLGTLGLAGAFLAVVGLLPMLLMLSDRRDRSGARLQSRFRFSFVPFLNWLANHSRLAMGIAAATFLAAIIVLIVLRGDPLPMESDLTVMHPRPNAAIDAQNMIARKFAAHDWLIVHLTSDSPENLVALAHRVDARLGSSAAKSAGVVASFGLASLLPDPTIVRSRQASIGPAVASRVVADFRSAIDESPFNPDAPEIRDYETFLKVVLTQPPPTMTSLLPYRQLAGMLLPRSAFEGKPVTEAITAVFISGSTDERESRDHSVDGIRAALDGERGATLTGLSVMSRDTERAVRRDLPRLSLIAVVIVMLYLVFHFRNFSEAILAMTPTIFSLTILLAAMRIAGQKVNMVNLIAAPLLIGIDVDYGIFLVSLARLKQARTETLRDLIARIAPVSHAVMMCALATIVGFGSLMWTRVPAVRSLGFAVAVGIGACLVCALFLLTPIFLSLAKGEKDAPVDISQSDRME